MANPLKKTMAYLGLVEDELEYDEEPVATAHPAPVAPVQHPAPAKAPVTPLRKPTPARNVTVQEVNEILTVHPRQYSDAKMIAESFREGVPVILNLSQMSENEARAAIDAIATELGAASVKDMGRVMAALKERHAGQMDMAKASGLVKARLAG